MFLVGLLLQVSVRQSPSPSQSQSYAISPSRLSIISSTTSTTQRLLQMQQRQQPVLLDSNVRTNLVLPVWTDVISYIQSNQLIRSALFIYIQIHRGIICVL